MPASLAFETMSLDPSAPLLRDLLDAIPDGLVVVDGDGQIRMANAAIETIFGYRPSEVEGEAVEILIPPEAHEIHVTHRQDFASAPRIREMGVAQQLSGRRRDGTLVPVEVSLSPTRLDSGEPIVIATVRDVTERNAASAQLATAQRQSALLADRERLARDLHDTVIQELFATGMLLQATLPLVADAAAEARVSDAVDSIDSTIKRVRETIFGLRSSQKSELQERVETVVRSFDELLDSPASLTLSGELDNVTEDVIEHLLPALRESLSNVAKHASATTTRVVLTVVGGTLQLEVRDDGVGHTPASASTSTGFGLRNLAQRAADLGGEFHLTTGLDGGTVLQWRVPLSR